MPRAVFVVHTRPIDDTRDAEYNDWYDNVHLPEVCKVPGIVSARRYKLSSAQQHQIDERPPYLAIYELDADDLQGVLSEIAAQVASGVIHMTDALQPTVPGATTVFELLSEYP